MTISKVRFWLYRNALAFLMRRSFQQRVDPVLLPGSATVRYRTYAEGFPDMPLPSLFDPVSFPAADGARTRLRRIKLTKLGLGVLRWVAPAHTPPVPADEKRF